MIGGILLMSSLCLVNLVLFNILFIVGVNSSLDGHADYVSLSSNQNSQLKVLKVSLGGFKLTQISVDENKSPGSTSAIGRVTNGIRLAEFILRRGKMKDCRMTSSAGDIMTFIQAFQQPTPTNESHSLQELYDQYIPTKNIPAPRANYSSHSSSLREHRENENHIQFQNTRLAIIKSKTDFVQLFGNVIKIFDIFHHNHICKDIDPNPLFRGLSPVSKSYSNQTKSTARFQSRHFGCHRLCKFQHSDHLSPLDKTDCYRQCISSLSPSPSSSPSTVYQNVINSDTDMEKVTSSSSLLSSAHPSSSSDNQIKKTTRSIRGNKMFSTNRTNNSNNNNYSNGQNVESSTPQSRQKRDLLGGWMVFPGTKWCGDGDIAEHKNDLGYHRKADKCCRRHDSCPVTIPALSSSYGAFNYRPHTISHCRCDRKFRKCLQAVDTPISTLIGRIYFNVVGPQCFKFKEETACMERFWWGACSKWGKQKVAYLKRQRRYLNGRIERERMAKKRDYLITNSVL